MHKVKKLVTLGCSHTVGSYLDKPGDSWEELARCHDRSWSRKLAKLLDAEQECNLAINGGSNPRSIRVLMEWINETYNDKFEDSDLLIIFSITEPMRFEVPVNASLTPGIIPNSLSLGNDKINNEWSMHRAGPWEINTNRHANYSEYIRNRYGLFSNDDHEYKKLSYDLVMLHYFLKLHNIKHYFFHGIDVPDFYKPFMPAFVKLPIIKFTTKDNIYFETNAFGPGGFLTSHGFKRGLDIKPLSGCAHFDHDANQFLAEHIYDKIKEEL